MNVLVRIPQKSQCSSSLRELSLICHNDDLCSEPGLQLKRCPADKQDPFVRETWSSRGQNAPCSSY